MKPLRIGIDGTCWWNQRGFGRFTRQLLGAMFAADTPHRFTVFVDRDPAPDMLRPNVEVVRVPTSTPVTEAAVADGSRSPADLLAFRRAVRRTPLDVMYFPAVYSWYPTGGRAPVVVTFHDAIAERFPGLVMPSWRGRLFWRIKTWLARRTAARITTVSGAAREEIATHLGIDPARVDVILEAADPMFRPMSDPTVRTRLSLPADRALLVYVGGMAPHKNLLGLLRGFAHAVRAGGAETMDLVMVGDPEGAGFHSHADELHAEIAATPALAGRVHFTGYVSDADLVALYGQASAVAMPAFSEGFGLPAAEAIACGAPVIAARGGAVEEIVGPAGLYFDPHDVEEIAATITTIAADPNRLAELRHACLPRAASMSWNKAAAATIDVLAGQVSKAARR